MKLLNEFKAFAMKGNVLDMAIGIIIGGAFGKIVSSIVNDILTPILGSLIGGVNFTDLKFIIKDAINENPAITINYGNFLQVTIDFLIIALSIFLFIKAINIFKRKEAEKITSNPPIPSKEEILLSEIRDLLKELAINK